MPTLASAHAMQRKDIIDWLTACEPDENSPASSSNKGRRNSPCSRRSVSQGPSPLFPVDDSNMTRGRGKARNITTRSLARRDAFNIPTAEAGAEVSPANLISGVEDVNPDQSGEHVSAASESALHTPLTLSQSAASRKTTSRSRSPTKKIGDLLAAKPPIKMGMLNEAPEAVQAVLNKFKLADICYGMGVFPRSLKVTRINAIDKLEYPDCFFDGPISPATSHDEDLLKKLQTLKSRASKCHVLDKPEPSWSEEVFRPMLDLVVALENASCDQEVQVENVITSPISPWSLIPIGLQNLPYSSKKVDYCIFISQSDDQHNHTQEVLTMRNIDIDDFNINQAGSSHYIRWLPQLAAIECMKTLPGSDGMIQMSVWMAALRKRLEGLMKHATDIKPMPYLKTEGLDWKAYWCCIGARGETMLYGPQSLDSMLDMKGIYQVLKFLQQIVKYGRDDYWPWFRETILWES
ncbi:hypothetical protein AJ79_04922 [Helicocarpus griseus UAMH5409]|uniref:PD-(D/E)XK nuclease-like domain-containing protein n=1 Tax=Helicocarpus griseus UAMH5409 TaxID=1447875 RepID=A0A2B7XRN8_9EURO|nr:hypothetical protein AJ79_04922 [Helicocarpus griseus UAMH5409]